MSRVTGIVKEIAIWSGVIALATVVFKGGALANVVSNLEARVSHLENGGSVVFREHSKEDFERDKTALEAIHVLQQQVATLIEMRGDVKVINSKLDSLKEELNRKAHQ